MDPHKRSVTFEARDTREVLRVIGTLLTDRDGYRALRQVARQWPDRIWAIEGASPGTVCLIIVDMSEWLAARGWEVFTQIQEPAARGGALVELIRCFPEYRRRPLYEEIFRFATSIADQ